MFNKNFNIILGDRASGKTFFLWEISKILKEFGYKMCYVGCTNEFNNDDELLKNFSFVRILTTNSSSSMSSDVKLVKEIMERDKYDFLFVDDIDWAEKNIQKLIKSIGITKIFTCNEIPIIGEDFNLFKLNINYDDSNFKEVATIEHVDGIQDQKSFLISLHRELKINKVLK